MQAIAEKCKINLEFKMEDSSWVYLYLLYPEPIKMIIKRLAKCNPRAPI